MQQYTLHNQVVSPQCQYQAWIKEEGVGKSLCRVPIRPGFPGHVLFFGPCPGVRAGFQKCPGFVPVFNPSITDRLKIRLLPWFFHVCPRSFDRYLRTYFSVFLIILFRGLNTRASNISLNGKVTIGAGRSLRRYGPNRSTTSISSNLDE